MLRLAHAPVAVARRRERDLGAALSLAQLQGHPPLSRRYLTVGRRRESESESRFG